jgi:hypothetical protein
VFEEGVTALVNGLRVNDTLTGLGLNLPENTDDYIIEELNTLLGWNALDALSPTNIVTLPPCCKDRVLFILLIMKQVPICDDMYWYIMGMLKVRDVVNGGDPVDPSTWT